MSRPASTPVPSSPPPDRPRIDVVVPTVGRPSLQVLIEALGRFCPIPFESVVVVHDRPGRPLDCSAPEPLHDRLVVLDGAGAGPAAARNRGWRHGAADWIVFLDDDVLPTPGWADDLLADLDAAADDVGATQGRLRVPLPTDRRPTDWERNVAALESARWATADLAYRREALESVGGFDERFPRAYREDADLGLRIEGRGWELERGRRRTLHPVRPAGRWVSVGLQRGNADDARMRRVHGRGWRTRAESPRGRFRAHVATVVTAVAAALFAIAGRRRATTVAAVAWAGATARFTSRRLAGGHRSLDEVVTMAATSLVIPFAAVVHRLRGEASARRDGERWPAPDLPDAVLVDRDDTIVADVPYNGDPDLVDPVPGAAEALDRIRRCGLPVAVVTNQSGVGRGLLSVEDVDAVNARIEAVLGPFDAVVVCPHGPDDGCGCRKPEPGAIAEAARRLGTVPERCVVVGDIGSDVDAALTAGAHPILVPTARTRPEEVLAAPLVVGSIAEAVDAVVTGRWPTRGRSPSAPAGTTAERVGAEAAAP